MATKKTVMTTPQTPVTLVTATDGGVTNLNNKNQAANLTNPNNITATMSTTDGTVDTRPIKTNVPIETGDNNGMYEQLFKSYLDRANAAYETSKENSLNAYNRGLEQLNTNYANSQANINKQAEDSLRQAYISNMLSQKNLGNQLASAGISGGATETVMANMLNNYQNGRNDIYNQQNDSLRELGIANNNSVSDLTNAYLSAIENANTAYNQNLADYQKEINSMNYNASQAEKDRALQQILSQAELQNKRYLQDQQLAHETAENQKKYEWQSGESQKDRDLETLLQNAKLEWQAGENQKDRDSDVEKYTYQGELDKWLAQFDANTKKELQELINNFNASENEKDRQSALAQIYAKAGNTNGGGVTSSVTPSVTPEVTPAVQPEVTPSVTPEVTPEKESASDYPSFVKYTADEISAMAAEQGLTAAQSKELLANSITHYNVADGVCYNMVRYGSSAADIGEYLTGRVNAGYISSDIAEALYAQYVK